MREKETGREGGKVKGREKKREGTMEKGRKREREIGREREDGKERERKTKVHEVASVLITYHSTGGEKFSPAFYRNSYIPPVLSPLSLSLPPSLPLSKKW